MIAVVLGGDTPLGHALVTGLVASGMIVIVSVSTPENIPALEARGNGYVRALVLDPKEVSCLRRDACISRQSDMFISYPRCRILCAPCNQPCHFDFLLTRLETHIAAQYHPSHSSTLSYR